MQNFFTRNEDFEYDPRSIIEEAAKELDIEWQINFINATSLLEKTKDSPRHPNKDSSIIRISHQPYLKHHLLAVEDQRLSIGDLDPRSYLHLAYAKLAEQDLILSLTPAFSADAPYGFMTHYLQFFQRTSYVWANDVLQSAGKSNIVNRNLYSALNEIKKQMFLVSNINPAQTGMYLDQIISELAVNSSLWLRYQSINVQVANDINQLRNKIHQVYSQIDPDPEPIFDLYDFIHDNYFDLPAMPQDRHSAISLMSNKTKAHAIKFLGLNTQPGHPHIVNPDHEVNFYSWGLKPYHERIWN